MDLMKKVEECIFWFGLGFFARVITTIWKIQNRKPDHSYCHQTNLKNCIRFNNLHMLDLIHLIISVFRLTESNIRFFVRSLRLLNLIKQKLVDSIKGFPREGYGPLKGLLLTWLDLRSKIDCNQKIQCLIFFLGKVLGKNGWWKGH